MLPVMLAAMLAVIVFAIASAMLELALIEVLLGSAVNGILERQLTDTNFGSKCLLIPKNACSFLRSGIFCESSCISFAKAIASHL